MVGHITTINALTRLRGSGLRSWSRRRHQQRRRRQQRAHPCRTRSARRRSSCRRSRHRPLRGRQHISRRDWPRPARFVTWPIRLTLRSGKRRGRCRSAVKVPLRAAAHPRRFFRSAAAYSGLPLAPERSAAAAWVPEGGCGGALSACLYHRRSRRV